MRTRIGSVALGALALVVTSCTDTGPVSPPTPAGPQLATATALPPVRISEFHYDNGGTDTGEAIEVSAPAAADLTGWTVVLYNGNGGVTYSTRSLTGIASTVCGARKVAVLSYPVDGIQNGSPDGMALVDPAGAVVEFLSYEGPMTATNGPAIGMTSVDVGVRENGEPLVEGRVLSLSRTGAGVWEGPKVNTFGACNDQDEPPAAAARVAISPETATVAVGGTQSFTAAAFDAADKPIVGATVTWTTSAPDVATIDAGGVATGRAVGDALVIATAASGVADTVSLRVEQAGPAAEGLRIAEIHYDNDGTDTGEAIEVEGPGGASVAGWSVVLYDGGTRNPYGEPRVLTGNIPVLCEARGVVVLEYASNGIQNGSPDGVALVGPDGRVAEFLSYEGSFVAASGPAAGMQAVDIGVSEAGTTRPGRSLQRTSAGTWFGPSAATFGACNPDTPPVERGSISFSGRNASDPALPVGFEDQIFATVRDANGQTVTTTITWASETPDIATVDQTGVMRAVGAGTAVLRATAADSTTATYTLATRVAEASATASYEGNAEFGEPADADASDDVLVRYPQFTSSWNPSRGTPNWVSYNLEATHFGPEDRCDCFTFDQQLPPSATRYTTADYTGAGTFHGYGIDRGHLARSFDRTAASLDNARSYYFTNIIPQAADNNQGPWAVMENYLGDLARKENKEVYIVAGASGSRGTIKDQGKITIPATTWKVAVVMPHDRRLADVKDYRDLDVVAVVMPNVAGIRNVGWETYKVTVDSVEALTGYDLLALLPDKVERAVESNTRPPLAAVDGPYAATEGAALTLSAANSIATNGALTYAWDFGDGATATGVSPSHTYAQDGRYTVRLTVTDEKGLADTDSSVAAIANVPPVVTLAAAVGPLLPGETYATTGSFSDPGADRWSATVSYDDPTVPPSALALSGNTFSLSHAYAAPGTFTVGVRIADDDATGTATAAVQVLTIATAIDNALGLVDALGSASRLAAGKRTNDGIVTALRSKLEAAKAQLSRGDTASALVELRSVVAELDSLVADGRLTSDAASPLRTYVGRIIVSLSR